MTAYRTHRAQVEGCPQPETEWKPIVYGLGPTEVATLAHRRQFELRNRIEAEARECEACLQAAHDATQWRRPDYSLIASLRTLASEHARMAFHLSHSLAAVAA